MLFHCEINCTVNHCSSHVCVLINTSFLYGTQSNEEYVITLLLLFMGYLSVDTGAWLTAPLSKPLLSARRRAWQELWPLSCLICQTAASFSLYLGKCLRCEDVSIDFTAHSGLILVWLPAKDYFWLWINEIDASYPGTWNRISLHFTEIHKTVIRGFHLWIICCAVKIFWILYKHKPALQENWRIFSGKRLT